MSPCCFATSSASLNIATAIRRSRSFAELETLIANFEEIVEAHGLEKIKTIGDAFMATAGLLQLCRKPGSKRR